MILQKTERFQKDIKEYTAAIEKLPEGHEKLEAKRLLNELVHEVKNMDNMFLDMVYAKQLPSLGSDIKNKIVEIRKSLDKITKNLK